MDDPRWLRLLVIGLVLAAVAVGYFLLSGKFFSTNIVRVSPSPTPAVLGQNASPTPTSTPQSAYDRIVSRTQNGTQVLPRTGFPAGAAALFSASAIIIGWGLRKYPK